MMIFFVGIGQHNVVRCVRVNQVCISVVTMWSCSMTENIYLTVLCTLEYNSGNLHSYFLTQSSVQAKLQSKRLSNISLLIAFFVLHKIKGIVFS